MKRIVMLLTVVALMVVMLAVAVATAAIAQGEQRRSPAATLPSIIHKLCPFVKGRHDDT